LKGRRFDDVETMEHIVLEQLLVIPEIKFESCSNHYQEEWNAYEGV
jgi:hypothetical protein